MASDRLLVTTYFLELRTAPEGPAVSAPPGSQVVRTERCTASFYRYLYREVGEAWLWYERWDISDAQLLNLLEDTEIYVLWCNGVPAGYAELRRHSSRDTQILYFGLVGEFIGRGLGRFFLDWTVRHALSSDIDRLWVHTCSLDHERALATYEAAGFRVYRKESARVAIPAAAHARRSRRQGKST